MQRWQDYSRDPNVPELMRRRREVLHGARAVDLIFDRVGYLCGVVAGKSVLDIGIVEHTREACEDPNWLHSRLCRSAARCVGIDILPAEIEHIRSRGFEVLCTDITVAALPETFDVIVAGEVLEHVDAPGKLMKNCAAMLNPGGRLLITVPNPWYANVILKNLHGQSPFVDSADHVAWYDPATLYELGQRYGLELDRYSGVGSTHSRTFRARLLFAMRRVLTLLGFNRELFAKSVIFEFVRVL